MSNLKPKFSFPVKHQKNFITLKKYKKTKESQLSQQSRRHTQSRSFKSNKSQQRKFQKYENKDKAKSIIGLQVPGNYKINKLIKPKSFSGDQESNDYNQNIAETILPNSQKKTKKQYKGSLIDQLISNQYGYSNISYMKFPSLKKSESQVIKKKKQTRTIQDIIKKYTQLIPSKEIGQKSEQFRTLSTQDKSQKISQKRLSNIQQNIKKTVNKRTHRLSQEIKIRKKTPSFSKQKKMNKKKKKNKLPQYFGCLSINKVQSKLLTTKQKFENEINNKEIKKNKNKVKKNNRNQQKNKNQSKIIFLKSNKKKQRSKQMLQNVYKVTFISPEKTKFADISQKETNIFQKEKQGKSKERKQVKRSY